MDGVLTTFDEFLDHMKKHMNDLHSEIVVNDRLYSAEDYPKLKAVVVESGMVFCVIFILSQQNGTEYFKTSSILFQYDSRCIDSSYERY